MRIYNKIDDLIGATPLLELNNIQKELNLNARIFAKLECFNPAGSIKDRAALFMINDAEKKGLIKDGATIIEPTSGNTGIGLAMLGANRGYKVILTMPDTMSVERRNILKAYGAEVVLTDGKKGMQGAIEKAKELNDKIENSFIPSQFENKANADAHYFTTGKEIWEDTNGKVDVLISCIGSGGTVSGTGKFLKEMNANVKVIAVEPANSPLITKGLSGAHKIQGIGANFIPKILDKTVIDEVNTVSDEDAFSYARLMAKKQGVLVGISSGAALAVAVNFAKTKDGANKNIVVIMPDTGSRYLSTELVEND